MKLYTRKGDSGQTSIWGGRRLSKDDVRMEAIGAVDESNAAIGSVPIGPAGHRPAPAPAVGSVSRPGRPA